MLRNKADALLRAVLLAVSSWMPLPSSAASQPASPARPCCSADCREAKPEEPRDPRHERFSRERFMQDLRAYITREAGLTQQEANALFPLFFEMKAKTHDIQERINRALGRAARRSSTERDCQRVLTETAHMKSKLQKMEADFMKRMGRTVSPQKLVKVLVADQNFGRDRFRQMMDARPCGKAKR